MATPQLYVKFMIKASCQCIAIPVRVKSEAQAIVDALDIFAVAGVRVCYLSETKHREVTLYVPHSNTNQLVKPKQVSA